MTTVLPAKYRIPDIIVPTKAPSASLEGAHTALYSFIIALISLNGGSLPEQKLERYLRRTNIITWTPWSEKLPDYLQRLVRQNYLVRIKQHENGEEITDYMVGPRGKLEVGSTSVAAFVREVYGLRPHINAGSPSQMDRDVRKNFEYQLRRSLGMNVEREQITEDTPAPDDHVDRPRRRSRRATTAARSEDEMDESE